MSMLHGQEIEGESYNDWYDRLHPKVTFYYIDYDNVVQSIIENDNEQSLVIAKSIVISSPSDVSEMATKQITKRLRLFHHRSDDGELTHRLFAKDLEEAEEIMRRLKGA